MTGTTVAQAIPILISPLLTRIYSPEDFGQLALFMSLASIFGSIVNGRYELAIMLPRKDEDAMNIFVLGLVISSFISIMLLILIVLFHYKIVLLLNNNQIGNYLYFIPVSVFLIGLFNSLSYYNSRKKYFKDIAKATIIKSLILSSIQIVIGFFYNGALGLISGEVISRLSANGKLFLNMTKEKKIFHNISKIKIYALMKRYKNLPRFSVFATLANTSTFNIVNIYISMFFSLSLLGYYSLVQRVLGTPMSLIGTAISNVFFREATSEKQRTGVAIHTFLSTIKKSILISLPLFIILFFTIETIFEIVFGEEWRVAGEYAKILIPMFFIRFVIVTVSLLETVMERQKVFMLFNIVLFLTTFMCIVYASFFHIEFKMFLQMISMSIGSTYFGYGIIMYLMAKGKI